MSEGFHVQVQWDGEARVWWATSDDVPGLATEADNLQQLVEKLQGLVPELLELNSVLPPGQANVPFELVIQVPVPSLAA